MKAARKPRPPKIVPPALFAECAGPKVKCKCERCEDVVSADGTKLYGWRCLDCHKQWERVACSECKKVHEVVARLDRKTFTCRPCVRAIAVGRSVASGHYNGSTSVRATA